MVTILFTKLNSEEAKRTAARIDELPLTEQQRMSNYHDEERKAEKIAGRLLLKEMLQIYAPAESLSLSDLQYHENQPFFPNGFHFSIAHSGGLIVCAASTEYKLGIDVEAIKPVDLSLYSNFFTTNEWKEIDNRQDAFYDAWTKKEAVLKASGKGINLALNSFEVLNKTIVEEQEYFIQVINLATNYSCHIASDKPLASMNIKPKFL